MEFVIAFGTLTIVVLILLGIADYILRNHIEK